MDLEVQHQILNRLSELIDEKVIDTRALAKFASLADLPKAHELQQSGKAIGKIVLTAAFP